MKFPPGGGEGGGCCNEANLPSEGIVDSMMRKPRVLASRSAFTRLTVLVVICSRMPLITMARNSRVSRSSPLKTTYRLCYVNIS